VVRLRLVCQQIRRFFAHCQLQRIMRWNLPLAASPFATIARSLSQMRHR
jgi:hypothetical protein